MTLKVVEPIEVTEAVLAASDIPEPDTSQGEVEWEANRFRGIGNIPTGSNRGCYSVVRNGDGYLVSRSPNSGFGDSFIYGVDENLSYDGTSVQFSTGRIVDFVKDGNFFTSTLTGNVGEYSPTGTFIGNHDISTEVTRTAGICSDGSNYYVFDLDSSKIFKYSSSFVYSGHSFEIAGGAGYAGALAFDNGLIHYVDRINAEAVAVDTLGKEVSRVKIVGIESRPNDLWGVTRSGDSNYLVTDSSTTRVYLCDSDYDYLGLYLPGDRVIKTSTHQVYQCLTATSQDPEEGATEDSTATWIVVGPTNKWAMFDNLQNTKTINDTDFTVTLNPITYVNTLAVLGFSGVSSVRVEVDDSGGTTIYDKTFTASDFSAIYDHYTYVFYQIVALKKLIVEDLPPLPNTTIRVTFSGSDMQVGELAFGFAVNIGTLVANGTKSDRFRYREQQYNEFGYPTGAAPVVVELNTYDVLVPKLTNPSIQKLLDGLTGKNTLWVGDIGSDQRMITYGFFERSPIPFDMPNDINYQITVRASV